MVDFDGSRPWLAVNAALEDCGVAILPPALDRSCALLELRIPAGVSANDAAFSNEAFER